ncbi:MAG: methylmalonyl-CoA mutase, N-terminal domain [Thermoplasmata archaeon]|jgi:methylmalonyl-CoA mutase N-terminal domain/subunit|nr:methylmalonyl-CoA mutase, N-terminal domain [Thermoplasmata archaeon]
MSPPNAKPEAVLGTARDRWEQGTLRKALEKAPERRREFTTLGHQKVERLYDRHDLERVGFDAERDLGFPGEFPYTRGVQPTMYRGRLWTMRQFAGFGTARETNERFKFLLAQGTTGLSTAFDFPTLQGFDSDHEFSQGEVGKVGVAIDTQRDMETLFSGIPLQDVSVSMTINGPAPIVWAFFLGAAQQQGVPFDQVSGTIQNDILKEYQAQKMFIFPPEPSLGLVLDTFEWGSAHAPRFNTVSISGYHIREAGSTAVQELAFTLANGMEYVRRGVGRGLPIDSFSPRLSFFFNAHNDFFEEIAKYRAARRIWAKFMRDQGAKDPRSLLLRFHTQTAGVSCTREQPENNIVRVALQALAAVLGGTQSLHTNSFDEALALPTEKAVRIALRTQQIIAHESGVVNTIDPLGGSYYLETLTTQMEEQANDYFRRIEKMGGVVRGIENGFFQREIADAAFKQQRDIERGERVIVGVNDYRIAEPPYEDILRVDDELEARQLRELRELKAKRDPKKVEAALDRLREACDLDGTPERPNFMPLLLDASRAYCTLGEIRQAMVDVHGEYREPAVF